MRVPCAALFRQLEECEQALLILTSSAMDEFDCHNYSECLTILSLH